MKKHIYVGLMLVLSLLFSLVGCSLGDTEIEDCTWRVKVVLSAKNGTAIACSASYYEEHEEMAEEGVQILDMTLKALNGAVTVIDTTHSETHVGRYVDREMADDSPDRSSIYEMTIEDQFHMAVANTDGKRGSSTLILTSEDYYLFFEAE